MFSELKNQDPFQSLKHAPDNGHAMGGTPTPSYNSSHAVDNEELSQMRNIAIEVLSQIDGTDFNQEVDLSKFFDLTLTQVPAYQDRLNSYSRVAPFIAAFSTINNILAELGRPNDRFIAINHTEGKPHAMDGLVLRPSWTKASYLGQPIYSADITFVEKPGNIVGFCTENFAFCDPKEAYVDSIESYNMFLASAAGSPSELLTFEGQLLTHFHVNQAEYCKNFGVLRNRLHEIAHVEDYIFIGNKEITPSLAGKTSEVLLSNKSFLWDTLVSLRDRPVNYNNFGADIREMSALIRGLEAEVNFHIENNNPHFAIIAFTDFLVFQGIASDMFKSNAPNSRICEHTVLIMIAESTGDNINPTSILKNVLGTLPTEEAAQAVQKTVTDVVNKNFKSYEQRAKEQSTHII